MTAAYWGKIRKIAFKFQFELARHRRYPDCGVSADDAIGCLGLRAKIQLNLIQMKRQRFTNGAIVKIPLGDGTHTYGRLMIAPYIEVYDSRTREELEISEILESPVLFTVCFFYRQAISNGLWQILSNLPLDEEKIRTPRQFRQDDFDLERCSLVDMWGKESKCTKEDCMGHERLSVWSPQGIVKRILNHYENVPNATLQSLELKLE